MAKKILICGDSFAADWTVKYQNQGLGWPNLLEKNFSVTNVAQAGCGEYKIYKQIESQDLSQYDFIIVSHTSPYRLHTNFHPIHYKDTLHKNSDFIYKDVKERVKTNKESELISIVNYFEQYFDIDHAKFVHMLVCKEIENKLKNFSNVLHITPFSWKDFFSFDNMLTIEDFPFVTNGLNHYSIEHNHIIYNKILERILKING